MRVATRTLYQGMTERIDQLTSDMQDLNQKIASGQNINRPSDDPIGTMNSMQLKTAIAQFGQYGRNIQTAQTWTNASDSAISQSVDLVSQAEQIATEMATGTADAQARTNAATEVGQMLNQAIGLGNSQVNGQYIFAGYKTSAAPFSQNASGAVVYNGDTNDFQVQIGKNQTVVAGRNGQTVFMNSNLFTTLQNLQTALQNNDTAGIGQQLDNLKTAADSLNNQLADVGARETSLSNMQNILNQTTTDFQSTLSNTEDSDISQVMIDLNSKTLSYQATLYSVAQINKLTLLNYL